MRTLVVGHLREARLVCAEVPTRSIESSHRAALARQLCNRRDIGRAQDIAGVVGRPSEGVWGRGLIPIWTFRSL